MKYFAFISYQRDDEKWAEWLAHELEHYHLPTSLNERKNLPTDLRPIFRDLDELSAGNLPQQIHQALNESRHLIVICSPNSAKSPWVNNEIRAFIMAGKTDKIFPFIIDGKAMCKEADNPLECFPPALRNLPKEEERLGANISEKGRDAAVVKVIAGMLGLSFNTLWKRYEREKAEEERKIREQRDNLLKMQSRYLSEKANTLVEEGDSYTARRLAVEALPNNIYNPDRPYIPEAEKALRNALLHNSAIHRSMYHINDLKVSSDGKLIFISYTDYESRRGVHSLDVDTCAIVHDYTGFDSEITSIHISSDNRYMAASDRTKVILWNLSTGQVVNQISITDATISDIAISNDNQRLAISSYDYYYENHNENTTSIYNVCNGERLFSLGWLNGNDSFVEFTPDDKFIITKKKQSSEFKVWNSATGGRKRTIRSSYGSYCMSHDGKMVAMLSDKVKIYDIDTKRIIHTLSIKNTPPYKLDFSQNDKRLVVSYCQDDVRIWDLPSETIIETFPSSGINIYDIAFCDSDRRIVARMENNTLRIWDTKESIAPSYSLDSGRMIYRHSFNHDYSHLFFSTCDYSKIFNVKESQEIVVGIFSNYEYSAVFSKDGTYFAIESGFDKGKIHILQMPEGNIVKTLNIDNIDPYDNYGYNDLAIIWNDDNTMIAAQTPSNDIIIWNLIQDNNVRLTGLEGRILSITFSTDSRSLITVCDSDNLKIWDTATGHCIRSFSDNAGQNITSAIYSPDGKGIITGNISGSVQICEIDSGEISFKSKDQVGCVRSLRISSDGKYLAVGYGGTIYQNSTDNAVRIFSLEAKSCIMELNDFTSTVIEAAFGPNDSSIITCTDYGEIRIIPFDNLQHIINQAMERFKDSVFSEEERMKFGLI